MVMQGLEIFPFLPACKQQQQGVCGAVMDEAEIRWQIGCAWFLGVGKEAQGLCRLHHLDEALGGAELHVRAGGRGGCFSLAADQS